MSNSERLVATDIEKHLKVMIGDAAGDRLALVINLERATGLDALQFIGDVMGLFDMERLAAKEGRTMLHPFAGGVGALPIGDAAGLREVSDREAIAVSPQVKNE